MKAKQVRISLDRDMAIVLLHFLDRCGAGEPFIDHRAEEIAMAVLAGQIAESGQYDVSSPTFRDDLVAAQSRLSATA